MKRIIDLPSPCISVCTLDRDTGYCQGCLRTSEEIAMWNYLDYDERVGLLDILRSRRQELGLPVRTRRSRRQRMRN